MVKRLSTMRETRVRFLGGEDLLEKEMATHSTILAWKIPWTEEPGGLQSMGSQSWSQLSMHTHAPALHLISFSYLSLAVFFFFFLSPHLRVYSSR